MTRRTVGSDLLSSLKDEDMADVFLVSSDGLKVPAFRCVLGARSTVLRKMLCGDFKEARSLEIPLPTYSGLVLQAVVEFCCSDEIQPPLLGQDEAAARELVHIFHFAHCYELPVLEEKAYGMACSLMDLLPQLACAILDETSVGAPTQILHEYALNVIRAKPGSSLLPQDESKGGGVVSLSSDRLLVLLQDKSIEARELTLFMALKKWADVDKGEVVSARRSVANRIDFAKTCAEHINLSHISPVDLLCGVTESGLVEKGDIMVALKNQALLAAQQGFSFAKFRGGPNNVNRVLVEGAGIESVNGMYCEDGTINGCTKYVNSSGVRQKDFLFYLYRAQNCWYFAAVSERQNEMDSLFFYENYTRIKKIPPSSGWARCVKDGKDPPPTCTWLPAESIHSSQSNIKYILEADLASELTSG